MLRQLLILIIALSAAAAQNSVPLQFPQNPSANTGIGSFVYNGVQYVSLDDLAGVLKIQKYFNPETRKLELRTELYTIKVSGGNPFIVVTDKNENASLIQLPVNVIYAVNSFFIPAASFISTMKTVLSVEMKFDGGKIIVEQPVSGPRYDVRGLSFTEKSNGLLINIRCTREIKDFENWLKPVGKDTWLYITLPDVRADIEEIKRIKPGGLVKQILAFQSPTSVQLTIRLKGVISKAEMIPAEEGNDILVALHTPAEEEVSSKITRHSNSELERARDRWKLDVIVIDAGHGGEDPGAIGVSGTREKDITLAIALQLGELIGKKLPGVKVVYTRKSDKFVELYRRGQIANQQGGKLFISIHCNAMPRARRSENGFEIYLLRPGKTESALRIAERENAVIEYEQGYENRYQQLTDENFILLTMAQSAYVKYSEQFAGILQKEMGKHLSLSDNGVRQAGFYVLVGASMPNVLIETGYLSNRNDEKILKSKNGQRLIAEAIFNGVREYKRTYEDSLYE